jgi:hypothetical protein
MSFTREDEPAPFDPHWPHEGASLGERLAPPDRRGRSRFALLVIPVSVPIAV